MGNVKIQTDSRVAITEELKWLAKVIRIRIDALKDDSSSGFPEPPGIGSDSSYYSQFLAEHKLCDAERLILVLSLAPHIQPGILDQFAESKQLMIASKTHRSSDDISLLPTANTALFLLHGYEEESRYESMLIFETEHLFYRNSIIQLGNVASGASSLDGVLILTPHYRDLFIHNKMRPPRFSSDFPAHLLNTAMEWEDLILMPSTMETLADVKIALKQYDKLFYEWKMTKVMRPGCRVLLYGDSGQGKTLTASLLGKFLDRPVYRVDIAATTSKYVGETNQRLDALFNAAENKNWILFFDEGDAMLGQRQQGGGSSTSHYANQEVAFLLQRIETFNGVIIVATNLRSNIDYAFQRRFDAAAQFKALDVNHQLQVWKRFWPSSHLDDIPETELTQLIQRYALSPASIVNVIRRMAAHMAERNERVIPMGMLQKFTQDEEYKFKGVAGFTQ